jgi:hypothetical protein
MILLTYDELRELVDFSKIDGDFLAQGFKLAARGSGRPNMIWTNMENLEKDATKHALDHGFDPETMLVLYERPRTEEERKAAEEETRRQIEADPDWDDIQIGYVDPNQVIASVYKDMTPQRLAQLLIKPWEMRVFS